MSSRAFRRKSSGFTLIELLVVISIIALLIGILLPALGQARVVAQSALCLANEHGMGVAMANYEADNRGALPGIQAQEYMQTYTAGELGLNYAVAPYGTGLSWTPYDGGRRGGALLYATFEKASGVETNWASEYPYSDANYYAGTLEPATWAWNAGATNISADGKSGTDSSSTTIYTAPVGLGYLGAYISPTGTADGANGKLFYCPGSTASFNIPNYLAFAYNGQPYGGAPVPSSLFVPRPDYGAGLYSTFLSDWNQGLGKGHGSASEASLYAPYAAFQTSPNVNPYVYSTYLYRSDAYFDEVDAAGNILGGAYPNSAYSWHGYDTGYPTSDAPQLNGASYMVCNSIIIPTTYYGYFGYKTPDLCHLGKAVNRAFHDGSARNFAIPPGHNPPFDTGTWLFCYDGSPSTFSSMTDTYATAIWPYYWAILDGKVAYPNP